MISFHPVRKSYLPALSLCALLVSSTTFGEDQRTVKALVEKGEILSLESLLAKQSLLLRGKLLDVELEYENMRWIYEIEVLDESGRVSEYWFDAQVGERISQRTED